MELKEIQNQLEYRTLLKQEYFVPLYYVFLKTVFGMFKSLLLHFLSITEGLFYFSENFTIVQKE